MKELLVHIVAPSKAKLLITYAAYLARALKLSVRYLHVQAPPNFPLDLHGTIRSSGKLTVRDFEREKEKLIHHFELQINFVKASDPGLPSMDYDIVSGNPPEVIYKYCKDPDVDAVMLGSTTESTLLSYNSDNVEIIKKINQPVWIIPDAITYKPFSEILYATDYHQEDLPNMKQLFRIMSGFQSRITAVHVTGNVDFHEKAKGEEFISRIKEETGYELVSVKVLPATRGEPIVEELHNFALKMNADLIVLLRENRGFFDRLLHGSRSEKLAKVTQLPVLIFNEERK
jgi:nucleotide-binding universal stress UspA family protein